MAFTVSVTNDSSNLPGEEIKYINTFDICDITIKSGCMISRFVGIEVYSKYDNLRQFMYCLINNIPYQYIEFDLSKDSPYNEQEIIYLSHKQHGLHFSLEIGTDYEKYSLLTITSHDAMLIIINEILQYIERVKVFRTQWTGPKIREYESDESDESDDE